MHITQWGEYGLHCAAYIAERERAGSAVVSAHEISQAQHIPQQYAQQILHRLKRNGIIKSVRGPQGGYSLERPAEDITLYDILVASEGGTFDIICEAKPLNIERCAPATPCNLRHIWYRLGKHINQFLSSYTLVDLVEGKIEEERPIQIGHRG